MIVVLIGVGDNGRVFGLQCDRISVSAMMAVLVAVLIVLDVEKDLSYNARNGALPTRPKRCVVVKEHLPASLLACSGVMLSVCKWLCNSVRSRWTRCGHGLTVMWFSEHRMMTPCILCSVDGGCALVSFIWNPKIEFRVANVWNPLSESCDWLMLP